MFRPLKKIGLVLAFGGALASPAFGFSLLGPFNEAFQVPAIGYNLAPPASDLGNDGNSTDIGAPKNLGEEYRWNLPFLFYAYDSSFLDYFGATGVSALDAGVGILNSLENVDKYSTALSEFPALSSRVNFTAQALQMLDLRSAGLTALIEEMGLASPDRWAFCLHDRYLPGGASCPAYEYLVIQRNYDPVNQSYSAYVNNVLYDYVINEFCPLSANPWDPLEADAIEVPPDPVDFSNAAFDAVASSESHGFGVFFTGLTYDDAGGLRYLYSTNNINYETVSTDSQLLFTNFQAPTILTTSNLAVLTSQALTNPPAVFQGLYPNIVITSSSNYWGYQYTTNITAYFTNPANNPFGDTELVLATNRITNLANFNVYQFANVVTNHYYKKGYVTSIKYNLTGAPNAPYGDFTTNVVSDVTSLVPYTNGDYYVIPPGVSTYMTNTGFSVTTTVTNLLVDTFNIGPNGQIFNPLIVFTYFTNYQIAAYPVQLVTSTNSGALRPGIGKINFIRQDFDPLLTAFWTPVTNYYTLPSINTNRLWTTNTYIRVLTQPDILFAAADLAGGPAAPLSISTYERTAPNYNSASNATVIPPLAGPGTLSSSPAQIQVVFCKTGPVFYNDVFSFLGGGGNGVLGESSLTNTFNWGSFDGSTNEPVLYPTNSSILDLQAQIYFQITSSLLPNGSVSAPIVNGTNYMAQLQASAAQPPTTPYTWQLAANSPGFPPGMGWDTHGQTSTTGIITGAPTTTGIYDFTVQASFVSSIDGSTKTAVKDLFIEIDQ